MRGCFCWKVDMDPIQPCKIALILEDLMALAVRRGRSKYWMGAVTGIRVDI